MGAWRSPLRLCFAKDRLYLLEQDDDEAEEEEKGEKDDDKDTAVPVQRRRIIVLSLQGDILQVVTHPTEPTARFQSICCFNDKLLASFIDIRSDSAGNRTRKYGMLALQGL